MEKEKKRYMLQVGDKYYGGRIGNYVVFSLDRGSARIFGEIEEMEKEERWIEKHFKEMRGKVYEIEYERG